MFGELVAKNNTITLQLDQIQQLLNNLRMQMPNPNPAKTQTKSPKTAPSDPAPMAKSQIKLAPPNEFTGDWSKGRAFLNSCELYFSLVLDHFPNDEAAVNWALTFMKSRQASLFAQRI